MHTACLLLTDSSTVNTAWSEFTASSHDHADDVYEKNCMEVGGPGLSHSRSFCNIHIVYMALSKGKKLAASSVFYAPVSGKIPCMHVSPLSLPKAL